MKNTNTNPQNSTVVAAIAQAVDVAALMAELAEQKALNAKLLANVGAKGTSLRYNPDSGTISVYGLGRFPVSLRPEQFTAMFEALGVTLVPDGAFAKLVEANATAIVAKKAAWDALSPQERAARKAAKLAAKK